MLALIAPGRAQFLLARAQEYADSWVVCGVHFPSDIVAGRAIAVATVTRLEADPAFGAALEAARAEYAAHK